MLVLAVPFCFAAQPTFWSKFLDFWQNIFESEPSITGYTIAENITDNITQTTENITRESQQETAIPTVEEQEQQFAQIENEVNEINESDENTSNSVLEEVTSAILTESAPPRDDTTKELIDRIEKKIEELESPISEENENTLEIQEPSNETEKEIENKTNEANLEINKTIVVQENTSSPVELEKNESTALIFEPRMTISEIREVGSPITIHHEPSDASAKFFLTINGVTAEISTNTFVPQLAGPYMVSAIFEKEGVTKTALEQIYVEESEPIPQLEQIKEEVVRSKADEPVPLQNEIVQTEDVEAENVEEPPQVSEQSEQLPEENTLELDGFHNPRAYDLRIKGELVVGSTLEFEIIPFVENTLYQLQTEQMTLFLKRPSYTPSAEGEHVITAILSTPDGEVALERTFDIRKKIEVPQEKPVIGIPQFSSRLDGEEVDYKGTFTGPAIVELSPEAYNIEVNYLDAATFAMQGKVVRNPVDARISVNGLFMTVSQFNAQKNAKDGDNQNSNSLSGFVVRAQNSQEGIITRLLRKLIGALSGSPTGFAISSQQGIYLDLDEGLFEVTFSTKAKNKPQNILSETDNFCDYPIDYDLHVTDEIVCRNSQIQLHSLRIDQGAVLKLENTILSSQQTHVDGILRLEGKYLLQNGNMVVGPIGGVSLAEAAIYFNVSEDREFGLDIKKGGKLNMGRGSQLNNAASLNETNATFLLSFDVHDYSLTGNNK